MKTYFECIPCFIRQTLDAVRFATDDQTVHERVLREVLRAASEMDLRTSPPVTGQRIHRLIRQLTGQDDPYRQVKDKFNKLALQWYDDLKARIDKSDDPLETAVRLAIAGNIIDFGVGNHLDQSSVRDAIEHALTNELVGSFQAFRERLASARDVFYLADNAGEIVLDRLLIEQLPTKKITLVVKGQPVINDATMIDAEASGLTELVEVIDNGSDAPGTILEECSQEFQNRFKAADLVIAKGQGNYETLSDIDKDIFFVLKVKCPVIARHLGCEVGSLILRENYQSARSVIE